MANLVTFVKKLWKDATSGGTPITAAELNRMEGGINDCATQINKLGDSVSRIYLGDAGTFYIGWDKGGPYLTVINKDNSQQVSFRLSDSGNDNKPSTISIDLKTNKADTLWQAR